MDDHGISFWVTLIKVEERDKNEQALEYLRANCTPVENGYYIFEGDTDCLYDNNVKYAECATGEVPPLGDLSLREIKEVCLENLCWNSWEV